MNQRDNTCVRVMLSSVLVTFHRTSKSLRGLYKSSKLVWIFLVLCVPYTTPDEKQSEV